VAECLVIVPHTIFPEYADNLLAPEPVDPPEFAVEQLNRSTVSDELSIAADAVAALTLARPRPAVCPKTGTRCPTPALCGLTGCRRR
jgi:hypothetical protein